MIPDEQARRVVNAAFDAHGTWQNFVSAQALSFEAKASGPRTKELGDLLIGYVELALQPRSRWATHHGTIDIGHHGDITWEPTTLQDQVGKENARLLDLTGLFLAMPMPLAQSSAPPAYDGDERVDRHKWDVLALPPSAMGIDLGKVEAFARRSTGFIEMLRADFGDGRVRWIRGFAARRVNKLWVFGQVRWYAQEDEPAPAADPTLILQLGELRSRPLREAFRPRTSAASQ
jgi:hypothetical protein